MTDLEIKTLRFKQVKTKSSAIYKINSIGDNVILEDPEGNLFNVSIRYLLVYILEGELILV